jgi:hypothetical protein
LPSASEPHNGSEQSSPPNPGGQLQRPLAEEHSANWWHLKSSRLQLKHGGHFSGLSPYIEKGDCGEVSME